MDFKYNNSTLSKLEEIYKSNDYTVRYEKGRFNSGYCIVLHKKVVVINKFFDVEARINCLIDILEQIHIDANRIDDDKLLKLLKNVLQKVEAA